MNRRLAVKHLSWLSGTAVLLPGCLSHNSAEQPASYPLKHLSLSAEQEQLLGHVCETLLPRTTTPGAHDLGLPRYVLHMLDDCTPALERNAFAAGLGQLDAVARQQLGQSFAASTPAQRLGLLERIDQQPTKFPDEVVSFFRTARQLTIDGYTYSQYFMTHQVLYELVPGRYQAYFPVSQIDLAVTRHGQS